MADDSANLRPDGSKRQVEAKKHHAVCMWSWNVQVENCAICKNDISDLCIECQVNQVTSQGNDCQVGWGMCNHAFHHHCISRWIKTRATCPLCDREWELSKLASNTS